MPIDNSHKISDGRCGGHESMYIDSKQSLFLMCERVVIVKHHVGMFLAIS